MTLHIALPAATAAKLRKRAAASGKDVRTFVREAVEEKLDQDESFAQILAPVHAAFRRSGMSEQQAMAAFERARDENWKRKRRKSTKRS